MKMTRKSLMLKKKSAGFHKVLLLFFASSNSFLSLFGYSLYEQDLP